MKIRQALSKFLLSILLVSLFSSMVSGNTLVMRPAGEPVIELTEIQPTFGLNLPAIPPLNIQSAYADASDTTNDNIVEDCEQFGTGANNEQCDDALNVTIDPFTQTPPTGTSNLYDIIINIDALNDCDEFDDGDNNADCDNGATYVVGPVSQTNNPTINPVGTNVIDIVTDDSMLNDCTETGDGDNNAACNNSGTDSIASISQSNDAQVGDDTVQLNFVGINPGLQLENVCDETGPGDNTAQCLDAASNFIGPVIQTNDAQGSGDADFTQNNSIPSINQVAAIENDCDQSDEQTVEGDNLAGCAAAVSNAISSITQTNDAQGTHVDDIFQDNTGAFSQVATANNGCDSTTFTSSGDNVALCASAAANAIGIGPVAQTNTATGFDDVLIDQDNSVAITQDALANNDCDVTATNDATCAASAANQIESITQTNTATGDDFANILQSNDAVIVQNADTLNSCDESGDGTSDATCAAAAQNGIGFIGPVQTNTATGGDESTASQINLGSMSQNAEVIDDCDEENSGDNDATCAAAASNQIESITQTNDATVGDDTVQLNFVGINQESQAQNLCDQTGLGDYDGTCASAAANFIGPGIQTNDAQGSGDADFTQNNNIPSINQVATVENDCDQSDEQTAGGNNFVTCAAQASNQVESITQTNDASGTHVDDIFQDNTAAFSQIATANDDCDATTFTSSGDNLVTCASAAANGIGPVAQTNTATGFDDVLIDQDNSVAITQDTSARNDCDATATNDATCAASAANQIESITQTNTATGDGLALFAFLQANELVINQNIDSLNSCDESGDGTNFATCAASASNSIGPIVQTNTVSGVNENNNVIQPNRGLPQALFTQNINAENNCGEENTGNSNIECSNTNSNNDIDSITQTNDATVGENMEQFNFVISEQDIRLNNICTETGLGDNDAGCRNDFAENFIGPIDQLNDAQGSGDADISQENQIIGLREQIIAENDCNQLDEQSAFGSNLASCTNDGAVNSIDSIAQTNEAEAANVDFIFQDNIAAFSESLILSNDCDATTFSFSGDNFASCNNDDAKNFIGPVAQTNSATSFDDVFTVQDNRLGVSSELIAINDCDATSFNEADCSNFQPLNEIDSITQINTATGDESSEIDQGNDASIIRSIDLLNSCSESGDGHNSADCNNDFVKNHIGAVTQTNTAANVDESDPVLQPNEAHIEQHVNTVNDCNEVNTGFSFAACNNEGASNSVETVTQTNDVTAGDDTIQQIFAGINQGMSLENLCDETGLGDTSANCDNFGIDNVVGPVDQSNFADGSGAADFEQINQIIGVSQQIGAENDCDQIDEQAADGGNFADCSNDNNVQNVIESITQKNDASATHVDDIFQDNTGSFSQVMALNNDCDATTFSSSGDNNAECSNDFVENFIGPVDQLNTATGGDDVLIDQDNNLAVSQAITANNDCDATAQSVAFCDNDQSQNRVEIILQTNTATGDAFAIILQNNDLIVDQNTNFLNSCDESGDGINDAECINDDVPLGIRIGQIEQTNTASGAGQIDTVDQSNGAQFTQNIQAVNDCDEENTGDSFVDCSNIDPEDVLSTISQTNDATTVGDDTVQSNFVGVIQDMQLENVCDETDLGDNDAHCQSDLAENSISFVGQSNTATGSGDADFTQNNNIPSMQQIIVAENDCDQSDEQGASGSNVANCTNDFVDNSISDSFITQTNDATGTHVDDIFQDNTGSFSQVITLNNGCDATTFTDDGDNSAICENDFVDHDVGQVAQTNTATGNDDVLIHQASNVAVSQDLTANNDCDSTAENDAECSNDFVGNLIGSIIQENIATGDNFAQISQSNDATFVQNMDLLNSCDESGSGINDANCNNNNALNFIGPVFQSNDANGADDSVVTQSNAIDVSQNLEGTNDCDETNTGDNNAQCSTQILNFIGSITQTNDVASITGTDVELQSNVFNVIQNLVATNDCDESGLGDNNAVCSIIASNQIGAITQSNVGSSNALTITQNGQYTNDCDDTTSEDNDANCTINHQLVVLDRAQTGGAIETITQNQNLVNTCPPGGGACTLSLLTVFDPNAVQLALADLAQEREQDEEEGKEKEVSDPITTAFSALTTTAADTEEDDKDKDDTTTSGGIASVNNNDNVNDDETSDPEDSETQTASTVNNVDTTENSDTTTNEEEEEEEEEQKDDDGSNTRSSSQEEEEQKDANDSDNNTRSNNDEEEDDEEEEKDDNDSNDDEEEHDEEEHDEEEHDEEEHDEEEDDEEE